MTREEAITALVDRNYLLWGMSEEEKKYYSEALDMAISALEQESKIGHWIGYKCSECGNTLDFNGLNCGRGDANYCPNCGAKMESEVTR